MLRQWLALTLASGAATTLATTVTAVNNAAWRVDGQRAVLPVKGCSFNGALLLYPGSTASLTFNGTSISVLGAVYSSGCEAVITVDNIERRVDAQSKQASCRTFTQFSGLAAGVHTIRISVPTQQKRQVKPPSNGNGNGNNGNKASNQYAVFPLMGADVTPSPPSQPAPPPSAPQPPADPTRPPTSPPSSPSSPSSSSPPASSSPSTSSPTQNDGQQTNPSQTGSESSQETNHTDGDWSGGDETKGNGDDAGITPTFPPLTIGDTGTQAPLPEKTNSNDDSSSLTGTTPESHSKGSNAGTLVPAILVPILFLFFFAAAAFYLIRQRRRAKIPPSAVFRMENPEYSPYGSNGEMGQLDGHRPTWMQDAVTARETQRAWSPFEEDRR